MTEISRRKDEHLDIVLDGRAQSALPNPFDAFQFLHDAAPDFALADIDLTCRFLDRTMSAPFLISSMTGGPSRAEHINRTLALAAEAEGVAFAVGSQRIAIETDEQGGFGRELRQTLKTMPLIANIGAAQVVLWDDPARCLSAVDMLEADALIVHFNPLQEALQPGGDTDWRHLNGRLSALTDASPVPVIAKEVGSGISGDVAARLLEIGFSIIDVAGTGGTSWSAVEAERSEDAHAARVAAPFRAWGIPTPHAISDVRAACPEVKLIASGGVRDGLDAAKAIRLGADLVGQAAGLLGPALEGVDAARAAIAAVKAQLSITCFCTNARTLAELKSVELIGQALVEPASQRAR
ncbi:MAG: type 2 isopentenyl-diphosphate Delta-isomerase [Pseudomonadota bacterium]